MGLSLRRRRLAQPVVVEDVRSRLVLARFDTAIRQRDLSRLWTRCSMVHESDEASQLLWSDTPGLGRLALHLAGVKDKVLRKG